MPICKFETKKHMGLELHELQVKLDKSLLSRDQAKANVVKEMKRAGLEQCELQAKLDKLMLSHDELPTVKAKSCTMTFSPPHSAHFFNSSNNNCPPMQTATCGITPTQPSQNIQGTEKMWCQSWQHGLRST
jgi:hypothetical protein